MKQTLKTIIEEWQNTEWESVFERNITIPLNTGIIISLIGARRSGKTYILYSLINKLRNNGVPKKNILYLNFEDERLNLQTTDLDTIIQAYLELYPDIKLSECYLFFDEIQNIGHWEKFVRRIYDTLTRNIFITGSNAKLLSTEIATALRGRTLSYTIFPFSMNEYFAFKGIAKTYNTTRQRAEMIRQIQVFLKYGGFPEILKLPSGIAISLLQSYFNTMIYRDIVERYKITDVQLLKFFFKKVFANVSKPISVNKIYNEIKSLGYKISNNYLYNFMEYAQTIHLCFAVPRFSFSEIKQEKSDKKLYIIDTGLLQAIDLNFSENTGKLLENAVALEFLKQGSELSYFKNNYECDFVVKKGNEYKAVQVAYILNEPDTLERENRGLAEACETLNLNEGVIITFDTRNEYTYKQITIRQIPFYEYFLT